MSDRRLSHFALMAALTTASCSLFTDLGGLSSGEPLPTYHDAQTDQPQTDGGDGLDTGGTSDGGAGQDAPAGRLCEGRSARFCTDFDEVDISSLPIEADNAKVTLTQTTSFSAPTSMLVEMNTPAASSGRGALSLGLGTAGSKLHVALDMRVSEHSIDYTESLVIRSTNGDQRCDIYLALMTDHFVLESGCPGNQQVEIAPIPFNQWVHVDITVDTAAAKGTIMIDQTQKTFAMPAIFANGFLSVVPGVYYAKPASGPIRLAIDNVVVE